MANFTYRCGPLLTVRLASAFAACAAEALQCLRSAPWLPLQVITKEIDGKKCEPFEEALLEVPEEHMGPAMDLLGQRKGQMLDMAASTGEGATQRLKYRIPTRGVSLV